MNPSKKKHKGTRVIKKYANGGDVNDLLSRLNAFEVDDSDLLSAAAQPEILDRPQVNMARLPQKDINLISKPLTNAESEGVISPMYEGVNPNASWMYAAMNNMSPEVAQKWRDENPGTSPEGINMMGVLGAAGYKGLGVNLPGTGHVSGGVTVGDALNAYFLKEGVEGGIKHIPEFMEDPTLQGARNIAWDAIYSLPSVVGLTKNVAIPFIKGFVNAKKGVDPVRGAINLELNAENVYSVIPEAKTQIKALAEKAVNSSSASSTIKLADATTSTNVALKEAEYANRLKGSIASTNATLSNQVAKKVITPAQEAEMKAEAKLFYEEKFKQEGFMEHLLKSQVVATRINPTKQKGVQQFRYLEYDETGFPVPIPYDTPQLAANKLYEMLTAPEGHEVLEKAVMLTQEQMNKDHGKGWRGFYSPAREKTNLSFVELGYHKETDAWKRAYTEAEMGALNTLSPAELLKTLVHERDHVMRVPFMKYLMDNWALTEYTLLDGVLPNTAAIEGREVLAGQIKVGSPLYNMTQKMGGLSVKMEEDLLYSLDPAEMGEKVSEIQQTWWRTEKGKNMSDWAYKWDANLAREAYDLWDNGNRNVMILLMKGANEKEKFQSLADLMNNMLAPVATIIGTGAAVEAVADPQVGATQYNSGGFVAKKIKARGARLSKSR